MQEYDVLVIGSGASGGWAAKQLSEAGINVALVEAGRAHRNGELMEHPPRFELPFHNLSRKLLRKTRPRQTDCYAWTEFNGHWFANDLEEPYTHPHDKPFSWQGRLRLVGGRTNVWGRQSYRMSEQDLKGYSFDGAGGDWPLSYDDLAPYYDSRRRLRRRQRPGRRRARASRRTLPTADAVDVRRDAGARESEAGVRPDQHDRPQRQLDEAPQHDGRSGDATISVTSGSLGEKTVTVQIGAGSGGDIVITVTAYPALLGPFDFTSEIVATVTDNRGNVLADIPVIFSTTNDGLTSQGSVLRTNASGQAFDRLTFLDDGSTSATLTVTSGNVTGTVEVRRGSFDKPEIDAVSPSSGSRGNTLDVTIQGQNYQPGATVSFGVGVRINTVTFVNSETPIANIRVDSSAPFGTNDVTVTYPDVTAMRSPQPSPS